MRGKCPTHGGASPRIDNQRGSGSRLEVRNFAREYLVIRISPTSSCEEAALESCFTISRASLPLPATPGSCRAHTDHWLLRGHGDRGQRLTGEAEKNKAAGWSLMCLGARGVPIAATAPRAGGAVSSAPQTPSGSIASEVVICLTVCSTSSGQWPISPLAGGKRRAPLTRGSVGRAVRQESLLAS